MGAQGPGWAVPRPAGGSEAPGLRGAGRGGPRSQTTSGAGLKMQMLQADGQVHILIPPLCLLCDSDQVA